MDRFYPWVKTDNLENLGAANRPVFKVSNGWVIKLNIDTSGRRIYRNGNEKLLEDIVPTLEFAGIQVVDYKLIPIQPPHLYKEDEVDYLQLVRFLSPPRFVKLEDYLLELSLEEVEALVARFYQALRIYVEKSIAAELPIMKDIFSLDQFFWDSKGKEFVLADIDPIVISYNEKDLSRVLASRFLLDIEFFDGYGLTDTLSAELEKMKDWLKHMDC